MVGTDPEESSSRDLVYVGTTFVSATDQGAHVGEHRPTWVSLRAQKRGASPWGSSDERSVASAADNLGSSFVARKPTTVSHEALSSGFTFRMKH